MKRIELFFAAILTTFLMIGFVSAQDTTLTITDVGNVGIGITSPGSGFNTKLDVVGTTSFRTNSGDIAKAIKIDFTGTSHRIYTDATSGTPYDLILGTYPNGHSNQLFLQQSTGNVGIGTKSPTAKLEVADFPPLTNDPVAIRITNLRSPYDLFWELRAYDSGSGGPYGRFSIFGGLFGGADRFVIGTTGNVGIGVTSPDHPLEMASGAHVTAGGVWTDASSRQYKENISNLTPEEAISALEKLNPVKFNYKVQKEEEYVGFIAEDVPDLVATRGRKSLSPMDIVAVLAKVVQQQQKKIAELEARLNASQ